MRKDKKSLMEIIKKIEINNVSPSSHKAVRDLRREDYKRSDEVAFRKFEKKQKKR